MTLFEALTGGAFDRLTGHIAGNLTKIFPKSQMPRGLPGGGGWAVLELTGTLQDVVTHCQKWLKEWHVLKPGIPEHGNTGTLRNTPEHPGTPEQPKNPGTPNLTMLFCFPITDHVKNNLFTDIG